MALSDAAFLAEVDNFLISSDIPDLNFGDLQSQPTPSSSRPRRGSHKLTADAKRELEKAKDRKRRKAFRARRRSERENLEKEAERLTRTLLQMQSEQQAKESLSTDAWQAIAHRQLQCRVESENEQRFLHAAINSQTSVIQKFYCHLSELNAMEMENAFPQCKTDSDTVFFEAFIQELDEIYAKTDQALLSCTVDLTPDKWGTCRTSWRENGETGFFQNSYSKVIPIEFQRAMDDLWSVAQLPHRQEGRQHFSEMENTLAFKFRVTKCISGRVVSMVQRTVTRLYKEQGRCVLPWRSFLEGEGDFTGMHANETGWIALNLSDRGTLMRICVRHEPMHFSTVTIPEIDKFTGMALDSVSDDGDEITKRMEKLTLANEN